jgi:hypothetical protein
VAIEPHPVLHKRLAHHVALNGLGNITTRQVAAGSARDTKTIFDVPSVSIGRSSLIDPGAEGRAVATVHVEPLDAILGALETPFAFCFPSPRAAGIILPRMISSWEAVTTSATGSSIPNSMTLRSSS